MEDRRIRYTKMVLQQALIALMKEKPLNQITITEICKKADINRNTFYQHYASPHDLYQVIETALLDKIMLAIHQEDNIEKLFLKVCETLEANKEFSEIIFSQPGGDAFIKKVLTLSRKLKGFKSPHAIDMLIADHLYTFVEAGTLGVFRAWVLNGFQESPKILSNTLFKIIQVLSKG